jgi:hypothetical protein
MQEAEQQEASRRLSWWFDEEHSRFGLMADLPAADGAVVAQALERTMAEVPVLPGEEDSYYHQARQADALVVLCSGGIRADTDPGRATMVLHARAQGGSLEEAEIEGGPVIHPQTAQRLLCTAGVQTVLEDPTASP